MMVDTVIHGYTFDGGAFHPGCIEERPGPDRDDVFALYYLHDEDPHGTTCDGCYGYIFEPVEQHAVNPDGTCEYGCFDYCGDTESCSLHTSPEPVDGQPERREALPLESLWDIESTGHPAEED